MLGSGKKREGVSLEEPESLTEPKAQPLFELPPPITTGTKSQSKPGVTPRDIGRRFAQSKIHEMEMATQMKRLILRVDELETKQHHKPQSEPSSRSKRSPRAYYQKVTIPPHPKKKVTPKPTQAELVSQMSALTSSWTNIPLEVDPTAPTNHKPSIKATSKSIVSFAEEDDIVEEAPSPREQELVQKLDALARAVRYNREINR